MEVDFKNTQDLLGDDVLPLENLSLKGDDLQKLSVVQALPELMQSEPHATYARIIPKILQELPNSSCEFHLMTSKSFRSLMERQVPGNLLHAVLQGIESRDAIVVNAWMDTLLSVIGVLSPAQLQHDIIPLANTKSMMMQPIAARIASCRMLGRIAVHSSLEPMDVKRDVFPLVQSLCQDCHPDVRTAICIQLPFVAQGLGTALVKGNLLTSLVELAADDNMFVRSASISATVQMFPYTALDVRKATILPLVKQVCEKSLRSDDATCTTVAREIGKLVEGLQNVLALNESLWFLHCYKTLSRRGLASDIIEFRSSDASLDVMCRQNCASNLPAMSFFTISVMPGQVELLYSIFHDLASDPCYIVRRTVAGCLHEVTKIFGPQSKMMKPDLVRLLRDDSEDVLQMLVMQIGTTLELFCTHGTLSRQSSNVATVEIGRALLKCQFELTGGYNWRLLTHFIHQLEHLPNCMPPDFIHQHFTPIILTAAVQGRAKPVRSQAVRTLLVFLRFNSKEMQRRWLRDNLVTQLCYSKSCYTRHIFVRMCVNAIDIFSEKYFKEYFYENLLDLAEDPVANIRLCVASLLAVLKEMLILPEDHILNEHLQEVIERFQAEEKDRDVMEIVRRKMEEIHRPPMTVDKEEHQQEQKRRQEEEERVTMSGKSNVRLPTTTKKTIPKPVSRGPSLQKQPSSNGKANSNSQRSYSVPPKGGTPGNQPNNDMTFLEHHFYIDAGINLPTQPKSPQISRAAGNSDIETLKLSELTNITDDDKVNLRKLSNNKQPSSDKKNKRYSSILSVTCLEKNQEQKVLNRRSLTITRKEMSKIPVSSSKNCVKKQVNAGEINLAQGKSESQAESRIDSKENDENDNGNNGAKSIVINDNDCAISSSKSNLLVLESNNNNNNNESSCRSPSHLPVLKRRSQSEVRKTY